jgi:hypothetical protein
MTIDAYPLCWPDGWPRTQPEARERTTFKVSTERAVTHLFGELRLMGASNVVLSSNVAVRRDGRPYASALEPKDCGVAVYWDDRRRRPMVIANDSWRTVRENIHALGLTVEAIRSIRRHGSSELLERAFGGFARLPAAPDPWSTLGIARSSANAESVKQRYRELAREHHPDKGGDAAAMASINAAFRQALAEVAA